MKRKVHNIVSISGGKDSTATALKAVEEGAENVTLVFADTGHEHALTYEYIDYLEGVLDERYGFKLQRVRADFSERIQNKRKVIAEKWRKDGVPEDRVQKALKLAHPTGNPFLDLCMVKGRFPSTRARFCSQELKHIPIDEQVVQPIMDRPDTQAVISWRGLRADESHARAKRQRREVEFGAWEPEPEGLLIYHPIIDWTAEDVFDLHKRHGIKWNPLYMKGMGRVGCFPCIHARKGELLHIAKRFPEAFDKLRKWESVVSDVSKRGQSTFFAPNKVPGAQEYTPIDDVMLWALTSRGGHQFDMLSLIDEAQGGESCSSIYGLCE